MTYATIFVFLPQMLVFSGVCPIISGESTSDLLSEKGAMLRRYQEPSKEPSKQSRLNSAIKPLAAALGSSKRFSGFSPEGSVRRQR